MISFPELSAMNDNHNNTEQHDNDYYFDTSNKFENLFVSFQSGNDDIFKPKKMNLVNGKNLMRILRLMTKDRNT